MYSRKSRGLKRPDKVTSQHRFFERDFAAVHPRNKFGLFLICLCGSSVEKGWVFVSSGGM